MPSPTILDRIKYSNQSKVYDIVFHAIKEQQVNITSRILTNSIVVNNIYNILSVTHPVILDMYDIAIDIDKEGMRVNVNLGKKM